MEWFKNWFNEDYLLAYGRRDHASAEYEVEQMQSWTGLKKSASVLDLGCGGGRHLAPLAAHAERVVGVDLSLTLLETAAKDIALLAPGIRSRISLCHADLRALPFSPGSFDFLCSFFTSFGYLESDEAHTVQLRHWRELLRTDGKLFLDCINPSYVKNSLEPLTCRNEGSIQIREERKFTEDGRFIEKTLTLEPTGTEARTYQERVRLFTAEDLSLMLKTAGYSALRIAGNYSGEPFSANSERLIVLATI